MSLRRMIGLAAVMACVGALLEYAGLAELHYRGHKLWSTVWTAVWLLPLLHFGWQLLGLGLVRGAGRWFAVLRQPATLLGVSAGLALASPIFTFYPRLHQAALWLIVVGVASVVARSASRWPGLASVRTLRWMGAVTGAMALLIAVGVTITERRARLGSGPESIPPSSTAGAHPNVLLVILDTVRAIDLSLYGYRLPTTPFLERLSGESVVFEQAYAPAPWTLPTHATIFTGLWPNQLNADWGRPLSPTRVTLAELFRAYGYRTGGVAANPLYTTSASGLSQGFEYYDDFGIGPGYLIRHLAIGRAIKSSRWFQAGLGPNAGFGRKTAADVGESFLSWVDRTSADRPFFAFLNFYDAHRAYLPTKAVRGRLVEVPKRSIAGTLRAMVRRSTIVGRDSSEIRWLRLRYDEAIMGLDHELEAIVRGLADRGLWENTLLVVTGDHGELFGEHDLLTHGNSLYANVLRVPLLIRPPSGTSSSTRVNGAASLRDLPRTILELSGFDPGLVPGRSLQPVWAGRQAARSPALSMVSRADAVRKKAPASWGDMVSVVARGYHYILNGDGTEEFYRSVEDPSEKVALDRSAVPITPLIDSIIGARWSGRASLGEPLFPSDDPE